MRMIWVGLGIALGGCAAEEATVEDRLAGWWVAEAAGDFNCVHSLSFEEPAHFVRAFICALNGGEVGYEMVGGSFEVDGDSLLLTPERSTCPGTADETVRLGFELLDGDDTLQVSGSTSAIRYRRKVDEGSSDSIAVFGCFDADLVLHESPIADIR